MSCSSAKALISCAVSSFIFTPRTNSISICLSPSSATRFAALAVLLGFVDAGMPAVPIRSLDILPRNKDFLLGNLQFGLFFGIFVFFFEIEYGGQSIIYLHHESAKGKLGLKQFANVRVHRDDLKESLQLLFLIWGDFFTGHLLLLQFELFFLEVAKHNLGGLVFRHFLACVHHALVFTTGRNSVS